MNIREINHEIHGKCLFLDNGIYEIGIPLEFGLRICHFSRIGKENVFFEQPTDMTDFTTPDGWRLRGGHRLWVAPESDRTYAPDNEPISYKLTECGVEIEQGADTRLCAVKRMRITLRDSEVEVVHSITNVGCDTLTASLWPISVMAPGGVERIPLEIVKGPKPNYTLSMWYHSSLADPRLSFGKEEIKIEWQQLDYPFKLGVGHPKLPVCYENGENTFIVNYDLQNNAEYTDGGVSFETYFSKYMVEIESLSPLYHIAPGECVEHTERWSIL